jgi:hypothetical protein
MRARSGVMAMFGVVLLLTGCGGADDTTSAPPTDPADGATMTTETDPEAGSNPTVPEGGAGQSMGGDTAPMGSDTHMEHEAGPTMAVTASLTPDAKAGYNLRLETAGFVWAPENASGDHADGEGHAHLYVDGEKIGRLYGPWAHLLLEPGEHEIRVTLNANDHGDYVLDGEHVEAVVAVDVPAQS